MYKLKRQFGTLVALLVLLGTTLLSRSAIATISTPHSVVATSPHGAGTVSRKAIRLLAAAMRSGGMAPVMAFLARHQATTQQIQVVEKYATATAQILDKLAKADQASLAWVRGQVEGLLIKYSGATQVDASRVAFWVEKMLDWGL